MRPTARAVPPTASAASGRGGRRSSASFRISARAQEIRSSSGGFPPRKARVTRSAPASMERTQVRSLRPGSDGDLARSRPRGRRLRPSRGRLLHPRNRSIPGQPALVVAAQHDDGRTGRLGEGADELLVVLGLPARSRHDRLESLGALLSSRSARTWRPQSGLPRACARRFARVDTRRHRAADKRAPGAAGSRRPRPPPRRADGPSWSRRR